MKISDILKEKSTISFEIFPPKEKATFDIESILSELAKLKPDFISVTNGAGGEGAHLSTLAVAKSIKFNHGIESIMHLICSGETHDTIKPKLIAANEAGLDNILALRGDKVNNGEGFSHASDLIKCIDKTKFCIGAAAYPEGHVDSISLNDDLKYLKLKIALGVSFFTTQLFFDTKAFLEFRDLLSIEGVKVPILPGIMPIRSKEQISKMIFLCGASLPSKVVKLLYKHENNQDDLIKAGIEFAADQIKILKKEGVSGIHLYTMNKPEIAKSLLDAIS